MSDAESSKQGHEIWIGDAQWFFFQCGKIFIIYINSFSMVKLFCMVL